MHTLGLILFFGFFVAMNLAGFYQRSKLKLKIQSNELSFGWVEFYGG